MRIQRSKDFEIDISFSCTNHRFFRSLVPTSKYLEFRIETGPELKSEASELNILVFLESLSRDDLFCKFELLQEGTFFEMDSDLLKR